MLLRKFFVFSSLALAVFADLFEPQPVASGFCRVFNGARFTAEIAPQQLLWPTFSGGPPMYR